MPLFITPATIYKGKENGYLQFRTLIANNPIFAFPLYCDNGNKHFLNPDDPDYDTKIALCTDIMIYHLPYTQQDIYYFFFDENDMNSNTWCIVSGRCLVVAINKIYEWDGANWNYVEDYDPTPGGGESGDGVGGQLYIFNNLGRTV